MICPVEIAGDMSALRAVRMGDHAEHGSLSEGRDGAGDESTGRDVAGDGEEDYVVAGGGDSGHQRPAHAADSRALRRRGLQRIAGPAAGPALAAPGALDDGGEGVRLVPGKIFRSKRTALSRDGFASWGRWRRRTGFCGKNTSPRSIAVFRLRPGSGAMLLCPAGIVTWNGFSRCSSNAR